MSNYVKTEEHRKKISIANTGKIRSDATKLKISLAKKGKVTWNKGKKLSEEHKKRMSLTRKGRPWSNERKKKFIHKIVIKSDKEYSPNWQNIRKEIYKRDKFICQECHIRCEDKNHKDKKRQIQCHHIDYNTLNDDPENLITLCKSCHMKTNFKKVDWQNYYKTKIIQLYTTN